MTGLPVTEHPYPVEVEDRGSPTRPSLPAQVRRHAELALRLAHTLDGVSEAQYQRASLSPRPESLGIRTSGVSDPTGDTAADSRRLALRAAAVHAELMLERTAQALEHALRVLDQATARWSGDRTQV